MMKSSIKVTGVDELTRYLNDLQRKQIPFATAQALTATAEDVRAEIVKGLSEKFTLRKNWWRPGTRYGFNVKKARRNDLVAEVFTRAPWMVDHETGATRRPKGRNLAVPSEFVKRSKRDLITKANQPRNLKKAFVLRSRSGQETIFQRIRGKGLRPMYFLTKQAEIKPTLEFHITAVRVVNARWAKNFSKALDHAIKTAK